MRSKINQFGMIAAVVASTLAFVPNAFAKHVKPPKGGGVATMPCGDGNITWGPISLWPPNHKLVPIRIQFAESESPADGDTIGLQITGVVFNQQSADDGGASGCGKPTSKQGPDFGFHTAAVTGPDSGPVENDMVLRAERCASLGTRIYQIDVTCTDDSTGAADDVTLTVVVPKSRGHAVSSSSN